MKVQITLTAAISHDDGRQDVRSLRSTELETKPEFILDDAHEQVETLRSKLIRRLSEEDST